MPADIQWWTNLITAVGVLVAAFTVYQNTLRARKELAVKLINDWANEFTLSMKHSLALGPVNTN